MRASRRRTTTPAASWPRRRRTRAGRSRCGSFTTRRIRACCTCRSDSLEAMSAAPVEVIDTRGDPRARGKALGSARAGAIRTWLAAWFQSLVDGGVEDPTAYARELLRDTDFTPAIERHA